MNGDARMAAPFVGEPTRRTDAAMAESAPWDSDDDEEEGTVEPMFGEDVSDAEAALAALSKAAEEFPLDAFIIPEQSQRVPTGLEGKSHSAPREKTPVKELADRLEKLSHRLRVEDSAPLLERLAAGDRLDTMLAGLIAGYLAASK